MSSYSSNMGYIGIASQTNQKTTAQTPNTFIQYLSDGISPEFDIETLHEGGDGKYDVSEVKTQHREKVAFSNYARPKVAAYLFAALLGKDSPTHLTTTPFYHTITVPTTDLPTTPMADWLTIEKCLVSATVSRVHRVVGAKLSSITLSAEAGMPVLMECEGSGLTSVQRTTVTSATYETGGPFSFYHGTFLVNTPTTTNFEIKSFSVKLTAEYDEGNQTTELTRHDINNLRFTSEITLGLNYQDYTMWEKANFGATTTPTETFSDGSLNINLSTGSGTSERRLQINIPKIRLRPHDLVLDPAVKTLEQPLSGMALKQSTTALVTITCYNTIATTLPL